MMIGNACLAGTGTPQFQRDCAVIAKGAITDPRGTARALDQITPVQATQPLSSSRVSMDSQRQNIASRLLGVRGGATGISLGGFNSSLMSGGAASADGGILQNERFGIFVNGDFTDGSHDATRNERGYSFDGYSLTLGMDYRFTDDFVAGVSLGLNSNRSDVDNNGGKLDTDGYSLSLFASYFPDEAFYVDGILTFGRNDYDQRRNISYVLAGSRINQTASADYSGDYWAASLGTGYNFAMGSATLTPMLRLDYTSASVDGYAETMSNPFALGSAWGARIGNMDQESFNSYVGVSLANAFSTSEGVLVPKLEFGWVHQFRDTAPSVNGSFIQSNSGRAFLIEGDQRVSDYYVGTVGLTAQFAGGVAGYVQYSKVFGYSNLTVNNFGAGLRVSF